MVDYKGKIYRLVCNNTGQQYIGSTTQSLSQRLGGHKAAYKMFLEGKRIKKLTSFSILSENNFEIILIEDYPCENKNQLERRERHFIETIECVNKVKPAQTREELLEWHKQYTKEHAAELKEYNQQYRKEHQEELAKSKIEFYQEHKEEILKYQSDYYQEHKEEKLKYSRDYGQKHKEELAALTICECGGQYQHKHKARHLKSIKHTSYFE